MRVLAMAAVAVVGSAVLVGAGDLALQLQGQVATLVGFHLEGTPLFTLQISIKQNCQGNVFCLRYNVCNNNCIVNKIHIILTISYNY